MSSRKVQAALHRHDVFPMTTANLFFPDHRPRGVHPHHPQRRSRLHLPIAAHDNDDSYDRYYLRRHDVSWPRRIWQLRSQMRTPGAGIRHNGMMPGPGGDLISLTACEWKRVSQFSKAMLGFGLGLAVATYEERPPCTDLVLLTRPRHLRLYPLVFDPLAAGRSSESFGSLFASPPATGSFESLVRDPRSCRVDHGGALNSRRLARISPAQAQWAPHPDMEEELPNAALPLRLYIAVSVPLARGRCASRLKLSFAA